MFKKTMLRFAAFGLLFAAGVFAQVAVSLDEALTASAKNIEKNIGRGTIVAVLNFHSSSAWGSGFIPYTAIFMTHSRWET